MRGSEEEFEDGHAKVKEGRGRNEREREWGRKSKKKRE